MAQQDVMVCIDAYRPPDTTVFRIAAADDILRLIADAHTTEFTIPVLVEATGVTRSTVWRAVDLLEAIGAVDVRETPQRNYVTIDPTRLRKDDPVLAIEQPAFHEPIRAFVERVTETVAANDAVDLCGIMVFGSVARGEPDRRSDIDLFVLVDGDRTHARRKVNDVVEELADERFDGDRFSFESYVESVERASRAGTKLREIYDDGIAVYGSERLKTVRRKVISSERAND